MLTYDSLTYTPDEIKAIDDINAIYNWVIQQHRLVDKYPAALPLITDFESWYGGLEELGKRSTLDPAGLFSHHFSVTEVNEAKRRKLAIETATNQSFPADWPVAQGAPAIPPEDPSLIKTVLYTAVGLGVGYVILKLI